MSIIGDKELNYKSILIKENNCSRLLEFKNKINPLASSLKIILYYLVIGFFWVLISDDFIYSINVDSEIIKIIHMYKGWIFILVTSIVFFLIIHRRLKLQAVLIDELYSTVDLLNKSRQELIEYNENFEMIVEGSNDGIWLYDYLTGESFYSLPYKEEYGYRDEDFPDDVDKWISLIHPEDSALYCQNYKKILESQDSSYSDICRIKSKSGDYRWIQCRGKIKRDRFGKPIIAAGSHTDITEDKKMEERLYRLAYYDPLTEFPNKYYLDKKMKSIIDERNNQGKRIGLAYFDIDDFKNINETMGHYAGDNLLKIIAKKIDKAISPPDFFGRIGGDEFLIIYHDASPERIRESIEGLMKEISRPWFYNNHTFISSISAGIAIYPDHAKDYADLFQNADVALSHVKENGKKGYSFFTEAMKEKAWNYIEMDNKIRLAFERREFQLYYQPQIDIKSGKIIGAESLIRWDHPKDGFIAPGDFIPFAEKFGYINKISAWVFNKACKQKQEWVSKGYKTIKTSINLSGDTLTMKNLVSRIGESLKKYEIEDQGIEIEITETSLINDVNGSIQILKELKSLNMSIALDDFGTGYSSLNYLKKLPIDILKIDRIFINDIGKSEKEDLILIYIIELAHRLNVKVMAEGVESQEQLDFLLKNNCDYAQGYYFYKPMPANEFEKLLTRE